MLGLKLDLASWGCFPARLEGTDLGAPPPPPQCESLVGAEVADSLPTGGPSSDKLSAGETLDEWFLLRADLANNRLVWYVLNCFSPPVPWQKARKVCFLKNWQDFWNETHKHVDNPTWVLLKLLRLGAFTLGQWFILYPSRILTPVPLSQSFLFH